jgi:hypothetical protein
MTKTALREDAELPASGPRTEIGGMPYALGDR